MDMIFGTVKDITVRRNVLAIDMVITIIVGSNLSRAMTASAPFLETHCTSWCLCRAQPNPRGRP